MTGILEQLKWESLKKVESYKGLKDAASIPANDLVIPIRHVRKHHSLAFQSKKVRNYQEVIQSDLTPCPQNQKGHN